MAEQQQMSPEQVEQLKEKIKNMSPEELKEFQKKQCIFCQIIDGKVQSKKIYEDSETIGILDINPSNPGHILLMPKEHYSIMPQLPEEELKHIFMVSKALSNVLLRSIDATGTNILVANGPAAGQKAQHFMVHVIPRQEGDNLGFELPKRKIDESTLDKITPLLQKKIESLTGKKIKKSEKMIEKTVYEKIKPAKKEKKIVEAEFKENSKKKEEPKKEKHKEKPKKEENSSINLDDIAKVLGVKK
jgi:histidine triad (HIT) family protein